MVGRLNISTAIVFVALFAGGCASSTPPVQDMTNAKMALLNAQEAQENEAAKSYYERAKNYYDQAQKEMEKKEYDKARFLAQKAIADARVAKIKASNALLQKQADDLRLELKKMQKEFVTIQEQGE